MNKVMIIGRTNVGKTLFMINFSEYLGLKRLYIRFQFPNGNKVIKEMSIENARNFLSSSNSYKTQSLQSIDLRFPVYKGNKEMNIIDSSGLCDGIHPDLKVRQSIVQSLECLERVDMLLHMVDISEYRNGNYIHNEIDNQIIQYGKSINYALLVNKIDLDNESKGLELVMKSYKGIKIIPISALYKLGFNEVKLFVTKAL